MYPPEYLYQIPLTQMSVTAPPGRTHLYYSGTPEFAFGSGLSYSTWKIAPVAPVEGGTMQVAAGASLRLAVKLTNAGPLPGAQRVLAFLRPRLVAGAPRTMPKQRLLGYAGAHLAVGESATLVIDVEAAQLAQSDAAGARVVLPGEYTLAFSDGAHEVPMRFTITGDAATLGAKVS